MSRIIGMGMLQDGLQRMLIVMAIAIIKAQPLAAIISMETTT